MKKFVGNVNGKEFTDIDEFTKAVNDAIASGDNPMMISSYYKECDCGEIECTDSCKKQQIEEKKVLKKPLDIETILLTRDSAKSGDVYKIPVNVKEMFDNASNIDEIKEAIKNKISANNTIIRNDSLQIGNLNKKIEEYNKKIENYTNDKDEAYSQIGYYNGLMNILNGKTDADNKISEDIVEDQDKENDKKFYASDALKKNDKAMSIISDVFEGFDKFLNDVGFWK